MTAGKVVYVDFRNRRSPPAGGFGGGPGFLLAVFLAVLFAELLAAAAFHPSVISSFFFGPTVTAVAVLAALGARRVLVRVRVARLYRRILRESDPPWKRSDRTLH